MIDCRSALLRSSAASLILLGAVSGAIAQTSNVSLDNYTITGPDGGTLLIKHIDFNGTNLSKDEITKLLSPSTPKDQLAALDAKLVASDINMPEATVTSKQGQVTLNGFDAQNVNAGKIGHMTLTGFDGKGTVGAAGDATFTGGAMTADGLDFSSMLAAATAGTVGGGIVYSHFTWAGLTASFPDKDTPKSAPGGNLFKITVGPVESTQTYDGNVPVKSSGTVKDITFVPPPASKPGQSLQAFGYDKLDISLSLDGTYDPTAETFVLGNYSISGINAGTLALAGTFGGIDKSIFTGAQSDRLAALAGGSVSAVQLSFANQGLFEKSVAFAAKMNKQKPSTVQQQWSAMVTAALPAMFGGDPAGHALASAISAFIASPKNITISVASKGGTPLKFSDIMSLPSPMAVLSLVDITAVANK